MSRACAEPVKLERFPGRPHFLPLLDEKMPPFDRVS